MQVNIRRKLDMARRVRDFCRTHLAPDNEGYTAVVKRLEERLARAEALAEQQVAGHVTVAGAVVSKEQLREEIHTTLGLLSGLARPAAQEEPELGVGFTRPRTKLGHQAFLTGARVSVANAAAHKEVLMRYGMPETFPAELGAALDQFEQALNEKHAGRAAHVGARADLAAVMAEIMLIIWQLNALNNWRFRRDPESLAGWKSARNVAWPAPEPGEEKPAA